MPPPNPPPEEIPKASFSHQAFVWGAIVTFFVLVVILFAMMAYASGPRVNSPVPTPSAVNAAGVSTNALTAPQITLTDGGVFFLSATSGEAGPIYWNSAGLRLQFGNASGPYICYGTTGDCTGGVGGEMGGTYAAFSNYLIPGGSDWGQPLFVGSTNYGLMLSDSRLYLDSDIPAAWIYEGTTTQGQGANNGTIFMQSGAGRSNAGDTGYLLDTYAALSGGQLFVLKNHGSVTAKVDDNGNYFASTSSDTVPFVLGQTSASHWLTGSQALSGGAASVTFSTAFSTTPLWCGCQDSTAAAATKCSFTSTILTIAGTSTDTIKWACLGAN